MQRKDIASLFKKAVLQYLCETQPRYRNGRYSISEKDLQKQFALALMDANVPFSKEKYYPGDKKRIDFRLYSSDFEMEVEIEWEAKQTDGFAKRTFDDLHKLDRLKAGAWGMFLAVNIGDKYERAIGRGKISTTRNASTFCRELPFLARIWRSATSKNLLKCNPRFWRWRYDRRCDVTVLSCFGKRTLNGWISH